jgi:hypothetical protein
MHQGDIRCVLRVDLLLDSIKHRLLDIQGDDFPSGAYATTSRQCDPAWPTADVEYPHSLDDARAIEEQFRPGYAIHKWILQQEAETGRARHIPILAPPY